METSPPTPCHEAPLPATFGDLTAEQAHGLACAVCGKTLGVSRVYRGPVTGHDGALFLDADVYSCPPSADAQ